MHCSRMPRLCAIPTALLLLTGVARGQDYRTNPNLPEYCY
jgi:hypothetical protein